MTNISEERTKALGRMYTCKAPCQKDKNRKHGSNIWRQKGKAGNSDTLSPPAKEGTVRSKQRLTHRAKLTVRELNHKGPGILSGASSDEKRSVPRRIKLARRAKKSKALMITGPAI